MIPTSTWKVAVILPHDQGLANVHDYRDLEVIAVNMPNEPGVRNVDWNTYLTTVDAIETLTGYDLLALLPDDVEARGRVQYAAAARRGVGPGHAIAEGGSATFDAPRIDRSERHDRELRLGLWRRQHRRGESVRHVRAGRRVHCDASRSPTTMD